MCLFQASLEEQKMVCLRQKRDYFMHAQDGERRQQRRFRIVNEKRKNNFDFNLSGIIAAIILIGALYLKMHSA